MTHEIYKAFDGNPSLDVKGVFLDLSKAFDRVWHDGLMYTLKSFGICVNYCGLLHSLISDRHQKEVFNGQSSNWSHIKAGALQGSIRGMLLPEGVATSAKLFTDDTLLFLVVHNSAASSASVNDDLQNISRWAYQRKMIFNPDALKQAQEIVSSRKANASNHGTVYFNNLRLIRENVQTNPGLFLDSKLNFFDHINLKILKATKGVNVVRKMNLLLPCSSLLAIYESSVRPHLDQGDLAYDQPNNSRLSDKIETVQHNAALAITGAIIGTSEKKLYQELGFESLKDRRWLRQNVILI